MLGGLTKREHWFWNAYEVTTTLAGLLFMAATALFVWNLLATALGWPTVLADKATWIVGTALGAAVWVMKADILKYKITRDPRDEPSRKWVSFKYAKKYLPNEVIFVPDGYEGDRSDLKITRCPKCHAFHGFMAEDLAPRKCRYYGCGEMVPPPSPISGGGGEVE